MNQFQTTIMKWTFSIKNKIQAAITLLILCGVVFLSNYGLKRLSIKVGEAVESIYQDRLLVQDLLFSFNTLLDDYQRNQNSNNHLKTARNLTQKYFSTKLTSEEQTLINEFSNELIEQIQSEVLFTKYQVSQHKITLQRLEEIQIEEAKKQMAFIKKAKHSQETGYYFETAILIVLLVIAQILITANTIPEQLIGKKSYLN